MICPYCNKDMIEGYIPAIKDYLRWLPRGEVTLTKEELIQNGGVVLTKRPRLMQKWLVAYRCVQCNKIIIDIPDVN